MDSNLNVHFFDDLKSGIQLFSNRMSENKRDVDSIVNNYLQEFNQALSILKQRLHDAEVKLSQARDDLERQRNKKVLVRDDDGEGFHWEQADCSAEEARVARCEAIRDKCQKDVDDCNYMITDARSKSHIHGDFYLKLSAGVFEALKKWELIKERVRAHNSIEVPGASSPHSISSAHDSGGSRINIPSYPQPSDSHHPIHNDSMTDTNHLQSSVTPSNTDLETENKTRKYAYMAAPRRQRESAPRPANNIPVTAADRPRSPFDCGNRVQRSNVPSFGAGLDEILNKYHKSNNE